MLTRKQKHILIKFFSLFSVVRGYNILIVVFAQYITSIFILAHFIPLRQVVFDINLFLIVLASAATIAGGYIINSFYDSEKDLINRPQKALLDRLVSQNTKLSFYFVLNFLAVIMVSYLSFKAVLFFSIYIFAIWFYSHKLKKLPVIGNLMSAILTIAPFFAVFLYFRNFEMVIFIHASYLFLLISMRELVKDLVNIKGDLALNYRTIPVVYGEKMSKIMLVILLCLTSIPNYLLLFYHNIGYMIYFFYFSILLLIVFFVLLFLASKKSDYLVLHIIIKVIIVLGVFSILLIDPSIILNRFSII